MIALRSFIKGELRGIGAVADLTSSVQGKVEVIWQGTRIPASLKALGAECHVTGDTVRAILPEKQQDALLKRCGGSASAWSRSLRCARRWKSISCRSCSTPRAHAGRHGDSR